jgi:uncharacterized membrane protein YphA (DoxX/SURF4 family)
LIIFVAAQEKFFGAGFDGFTRVVTILGIPLPQFWGIFILLLELVGGALLLIGPGARSLSKRRASRPSVVGTACA